MAGLASPGPRRARSGASIPQIDLRLIFFSCVCLSLPSILPPVTRHRWVDRRPVQGRVPVHPGPGGPRDPDAPSRQSRDPRRLRGDRGLHGADARHRLLRHALQPRGLGLLQGGQPDPLARRGSLLVHERLLGLDLHGRRRPRLPARPRGDPALRRQRLHVPARLLPLRPALAARADRHRHGVPGGPLRRADPPGLLVDHDLLPALHGGQHALRPGALHRPDLRVPPLVGDRRLGGGDPRLLRDRRALGGRHHGLPAGRDPHAVHDRDVLRLAGARWEGSPGSWRPARGDDLARPAPGVRLDLRGVLGGHDELRLQHRGHGPALLQRGGRAGLAEDRAPVLRLVPRGRLHLVRPVLRHADRLPRPARDLAGAREPPGVLLRPGRAHPPPERPRGDHAGRDVQRHHVEHLRAAEHARRDHLEGHLPDPLPPPRGRGREAGRRLGGHLRGGPRHHRNRARDGRGGPQRLPGDGEVQHRDVPRLRPARPPRPRGSAHPQLVRPRVLRGGPGGGRPRDLRPRLGARRERADRGAFLGGGLLPEPALPGKRPCPPRAARRPLPAPRHAGRQGGGARGRPRPDHAGLPLPEPGDGAGGPAVPALRPHRGARRARDRGRVRRDHARPRRGARARERPLRGAPGGWDAPPVGRPVRSGPAVSLGRTCDEQDDQPPRLGPPPGRVPGLGRRDRGLGRVRRREGGAGRPRSPAEGRERGVGRPRRAPRRRPQRDRGLPGDRGGGRRGRRTLSASLPELRRRGGRRRSSTPPRRPTRRSPPAGPSSSSP
jgi:hypothetical protein